MYKLFLDTDCDVDIELCKKYGANLISMPYEFNGEEVYPYETWETFNHKEFYKMMFEGKMGKTFSITTEKYIEYFEPIFKSGYDILYIHFSKEMSSTFSQMDIAVSLLKEKYPERTFSAVDTKAIAMGSLGLIYESLEIYSNGATADEIIDFVNKEREHFATYYFVDSLKHFAKSGRVSGVTSFVAGLIGIKPLINIDSNGKMGIIGKVKGKFNALSKLMEYIEDLQDDINNHYVVITYALDDTSAIELKDMLLAKYGKDLKIIFSVLNPTSGIHCGPEVTGLSFHAIHR